MEKLLPEDVKLCNCAWCDEEILGESMVALMRAHGSRVIPIRYRDLPRVAFRLAGRPYCNVCADSDKFLKAKIIVRG